MKHAVYVASATLFALSSTVDAEHAVAEQPPELCAAARDEVLSALAASFDAFEAGDFEGWAETLQLGPGDDISSLTDWFEWMRQEPGWDEFHRRFSEHVELGEIHREEGSECWIYSTQSGVRDDSGIRMVNEQGQWKRAELGTRDSPFIGRGPSVKGRSLMVRTPGNQRVFEPGGPQTLILSFAVTEEAPNKHPWRFDLPLGFEGIIDEPGVELDVVLRRVSAPPSSGKHQIAPLKVPLKCRV